MHLTPTLPSGSGVAIKEVVREALARGCEFPAWLVLALRWRHSDPVDGGGTEFAVFPD